MSTFHDNRSNIVQNLRALRNVFDLDNVFYLLPSLLVGFGPD